MICASLAPIWRELPEARGGVLRQGPSAGIVSIRERVALIRRGIVAACAQSGRNPSAVRMIAVSKGFSALEIREALTAGISDIAENYLQEAASKQDALRDMEITWHFIGHLQRNKCADVARRFQLIHAVDSIRLAEALSATAQKLGKKIPVLIQIRWREGGYGFSGDEAAAAAPRLLRCPGLEWQGVMTMAEPSRNPEEARPCFKNAARAFHRLKEIFPESFKELSMGMSADYPTAVEEGATLIRIGRGIFGERARQGGA